MGPVPKNGRKVSLATQLSELGTLLANMTAVSTSSSSSNTRGQHEDQEEDDEEEEEEYYEAVSSPVRVNLKG
jgi:hypothetical protein